MTDNKYFRSCRNIKEQVYLFGKLYITDKKDHFLPTGIVNTLSDIPAAYIADRILKDIDIPKISKNKALFSDLLLKLKIVLRQVYKNILTIDVTEDSKDVFTFYFKFVKDPRVQVLRLKYPERYDNWKDIKIIY